MFRRRRRWLPESFKYDLAAVLDGHCNRYHWRLAGEPGSASELGPDVIENPSFYYGNV